MESVIGMINEFDTIAAIATAVSNAGIGIIRISGSEAMEILVKIFEPYNKKAEDRKSVVVGKECRSRWSPYH